MILKNRINSQKLLLSGTKMWPIIKNIRDGFAQSGLLHEECLIYTQNSISLRQRYRIINLSKTYERYMYRY